MFVKLVSKILRVKNYLYYLGLVFNLIVLANVERFLFRRFVKARSQYPAIFIVGSPRCGSTLLIQCLVASLDVGYISNRHAKFFGGPGLVHPFLRGQSGVTDDYRSSYGDVAAEWGPSECGAWWYRFFPNNKYSYEFRNTSKRDLFRCSLLGLIDAWKKPVIIKNLYSSLRINAIASGIPESLFIIIRRDEIDNAHSLLEARKLLHGDYDRWFSLFPPDSDDIVKLPPYVQVVEQVRRIYAEITSKLSGDNDLVGRSCTVEYEKLCANPSSEIEKIRAFIEQHGCKLQTKGRYPDSFVINKEVRIDPEMYSNLVNYCLKS